MSKPQMNHGVPMPELTFSQGPSRHGWDGRSWYMHETINGVRTMVAHFFNEGLLRRFLQDSWGVGGYGDPLPISEENANG